MALALIATPTFDVTGTGGAAHAVGVCGVAATGPGENGFQIAAQFYSGPSADDWAQGASFDGVLDDSGVGVPIHEPALFLQDTNWAGNNVDPSTFAGSNKNFFSLDPADYLIGDGGWDVGDGSGPQKNDLTELYSHVRVIGAGDTAHVWLILGGLTRSTSGASYFDFEWNSAGLVQSDLDSDGDDEITGLGPDEGRTAGVDFILSVVYEVGGSVPDVEARRWTETAPDTYEWVEWFPGPGQYFICTNDSLLEAPPWGATSPGGEPDTVVIALQFVEMAIDLTAIGFDNDDLCSSTSTLMFKTRSSPSFTSELKDFGLSPFPILRTPECGITGPSAICGDDVATLCGPTPPVGVDYIYEWSGPSGPIAGDSCIVVDEAGTYYLMVYDAVTGCCSDTCDFELLVNELPTCLITADPDTAMCSGATGYTLCGPDGMAGYLWSPGGDTTRCISMDGLTAGTHDFDLTVTDDNGCQSTCSFSFEVYPTPECMIRAEPGPAMCLGATGYTLCGPSGMASYLWSPGGETTQCISMDGLGAGTHDFDLTITDGNGCQKTCSYSFEVYDLPTCLITADPDTAMCLGETGYTLCGPDGMAGYDWSPGGETTQCISMDGLGVGTHDFDLTVTDGNGCQSTCSFTFEVFDLPTCLITADPDTAMCLGETGYTLCGPEGMAAYDWSPGGETTQCISMDGLGVGTHDFDLTVTDANGCQSTCSFTFEVYPLPPCDITPDPAPAMCLGATGYTLCGPDGVASYSWLPGGETTQCISMDGLGVGTHDFDLTVTSADGCVSTCSFTFEVYELPPCDITPDPAAAMCLGATGYTLCGPDGMAGYDWSPGGETTQCISMDGLGVGTHDFDLTVTDGNGCQSTCSFTFEVYPLPDCSITPDPGDAMCLGATGYVLCGPGGMAGYDWSPGGETTPCISMDGLGVGTHDFDLTVTDANGCQSTCSFTFEVYALPPCEITADPGDAMCYGATGYTLCGPDGMAAYGWSPGGETTRCISMDGLGVGTHDFDLTVTNAEGCQTTCSFTFEVYALPDCDITAEPDDAMCLGATGYTLCGPDGMAAYDWSPGGETTRCISMDGLGVGTHDFDLTVTDGNGCQSTCSFTFEVFQVDPCIITGPAEICEGSVGSQLCGPEGMAAYYWSPGGDTTRCISLEGLTPGSYDFELTVTDLNGCITTCFHTVDVHENDPCEICGPTRLCEGTTGERLCGPYDVAAYLWLPGGETTRCMSLDGLEPGVHEFELRVTDYSGCVSRCYWIVEVYERPQGGIEGCEEICIDDLPLAICGPPTPPGANWEYVWTYDPQEVTRKAPNEGNLDSSALKGGRPANCYDFDPGLPGEFTVTLVIVDLESGCQSAPSSMEITVNGPPPAPERPALDPELACFGDDVVVSWEPVSRAVTYGLLLDGEELWAGSETSTVVPAIEGEYCVSATNGCGGSSEGPARVLVVAEPPELLSADQYAGTPGEDEIEIFGLGFWEAPRDSFAVVFDGGFQVLAGNCISWSDEIISLLVPVGVPTGSMQVKACDLSNPLQWTPVEGSFYAVLAEEEDVVVLRWSIDALAGIFGFNIYRSTTPEGPFEKLNEGLLAPVSPGVYEDETTWPATTFWYELRAVYGDGSEDTVGTGAAAVTTAGQLGLALSRGWPNPFTDTVRLEFDLPGSSGAVELVIYDLRGRAVKRLVSGTLGRGRHQAVWDGTDVSGQPVPSGVYFARLRMGEHDVATKLLLTR
jgi:hypothetical protein